MSSLFAAFLAIVIFFAGMVGALNAATAGHGLLAVFFFSGGCAGALVLVGIATWGDY